jgi:hypothetical protein
MRSREDLKSIGSDEVAYSKIAVSLEMVGFPHSVSSARCKRTISRIILWIVGAACALALGIVGNALWSWIQHIFSA